MYRKIYLLSICVVIFLFGTIQANAFTLTDTGGDCASIGSWDVSAQTCTLSGDVSGSISIDSSHVTLDGAGHTLDAGTGVLINSVASTTVKNLTVINSSYGITVANAPDTTITDVTVINAPLYGFYAYGNITNLTLHNNHFSDSVVPNGFTTYHNPFVLYFPLDANDQPLHISIDQTNTVDGKIIYYFENISNQTFTNLPNAGIFYCVVCNNITLASTTLNALHNKVQINLYKTTNSHIQGNTITSARDYGLYVYKSDNNLFSTNTISADSTAVESYSSVGNTYDKNIFQNNSLVGIELNTGSASTTITHNDFTPSQFTIAIGNLASADVYQNNFYDTPGMKEVWIYNQTSTTTLSRALPIGGNYYQGYDSVGEGCADADTNGLCDSPRTIPAQFAATVTTDYYPWTTPSGWLTYTPPTPPASGFSNVLFIPGLEASRLYKPNCPLNCEDQLWEPNTDADVVDLYMNTNGTSQNSEIYTKDIIGTTNIIPIIFKQDIYKSLILQLDDLVSENKISNWKAYAYDWRQGIQDLVDNGTKYNNGQTVSLIGTLQSLINSSKNGKVTIITHSNGGLLAKALIKKLEDMKSSSQNDFIDHVDNLIMVASPQIGTPDVLSAILHGYKQSIPYKLMSEMQARNLSQNMPGAYGLLPSAKYYEQIGITNPAVFASTSPQIFATAYGSDINTYQEEHDFILGQEGRVQPVESDLISPIKANTSLLTQAETLHDSIDNMTIPSSIKVFDVAGWGKETIAGITYANNDIQPIYTIRGDKTVVMQSALYGQGAKYWLDLSNSKLDHKNILEDLQILTFISDIIEATTTSTLATSEPMQVGNRLHLSVHSPVSIGIYDNQGNFTGKICDDVTGACVIKEDIPGSTYMEFGEGKYVNLGQSDLQKVTLQGIDVGTFTFDYQTVTPSGQTNTLSFTDIPVTTQTQAVITTNPSTQAPQLALDVTGDGVTDFILTPTTTFDPITYLQVMKATIDSLDLTPAKIKAFDNHVDNIIKLIQKGKVDKAKLKADKFKTVLQSRLAKPDPKKPKPKKLSKTDAQILLDLLNGLLDNLG